MLGLAQQVGSDPVGIVLRVGYHEDLARPRDHVDPDDAVELALRLRHPGVARAGDHVDPRDALGAVGEGGDRLRAADAPDFVHPSDMRGGENERIGLAPAGRRDDDKAFHPRDFGRNGVHQQ